MLTYLSKGAEEEEVGRYYYGNLEEASDKLKLRNCLAQLWNCDETGEWRYQQRGITPRGMPDNIQRFTARKNASILGCINAAGGHMSSMHIFAGQRQKVEWMEDAPPDAIVAWVDL
ncbi:hypothetical protein GN958_ATG16925 [Phytophthora infestans]|uniref:Uncharacterized protein n=1 Tax=Phytophthora infestans TaxID=4787 RepID=A0A8S9U5S0_PHYIN|nr:hypothetical protein GN958_ATG16925 [Phytophthora infestans]